MGGATSKYTTWSDSVACPVLTWRFYRQLGHFWGRGMSWQLIVLWILTFANTSALCLYSVRVIVVRSRSRLARREIGLVVKVGQRVPSFRCKVLANNGCLSAMQDGVLKRDSVAVFVRPQSVASFRVVDIFRTYREYVPYSVPWTWVVVGSEEDTTRWVSQFGLTSNAVVCKSRGLMSRLAQAQPEAVYVDRNGRIGHAGLISDVRTFGSFISACPNSTLRRWFISAQASPRSTEDGVKRSASGGSVVGLEG